MPAHQFILVAALAISTAASAHARTEDAGSDTGIEGCRPLPTVITLPPGFQPEGITRGRGSRLYVGGIARGGIYSFDACSGQGDVLVPDQDDRKAVGLKYQRSTDRLIVAGGDTGHAYIYDASTGESLADLVLAVPTPESGTFINDVVLTRDAAYFTDSFRPVFYKVALGRRGQLPGPNDVQTIPLSGDYESADGFNANGIETTRRGDLLIVNGNPAVGKLYRVDPDTGRADAVDLGGGSLANGDGLVLRGRTLHVVENFSNQIAVVELDRGFASGEIVATITDPNFDIPATAAFFKGALYVTNARFTTPPAPDTTYTVVRVPIED
jgi:hypothetical protein